MSWFADLAGKAESLLNNLDEQTGAALRNQSGVKVKKHDCSEPAWQKKRPRTAKKNVPITETRSYFTPSIKSTRGAGKSPTKESQQNVRTVQEKSRSKSPFRKPNQFNLHNSPKTLVNDIEDDMADHFGLRQRRYSLPSDLEHISNEKIAYNMQNLEVENAMLKNELNVVNTEVSELLDRLRKTEDDLKSAQMKLECSEKVNGRLGKDKESLSALLESMKLQVNEVNSVQLSKYERQSQELESSVSLLKEKNRELEEQIKKLTEDLSTKDTAQTKLENELRHAQTTISEQQNTIDKTIEECHRLEKDWEAYKLRVKSMLYSKDNEIKSLREGGNLTEDTKMLMDQLETLKEEKEDLSQSITRIRNECSDMKHQMAQLESRHTGSERIVTALRDALKEERLARNRAEAQRAALGKELQILQMETSQTIASLRAALHDKDEELNHLRETASTVQTSDTSALNVADYDVTKAIDNEKIHYLTQTLIQKQGKIDTLMADNNILRIQLDKLESKHRSELSSLRAKHSHSVVHFQDGDRTRSRTTYANSPFSALSLRIGVMIKRFPIFRLLVLIYMVGLHLWVVTVLFTSTPEDAAPRSGRS
ncbi:golgin subfamily A member 5 [Maniola jurtina]|uniref:golgin subfamily A member 5 n=1 Tax=Maniola jurtina TaxID=191418 RepID=UPI001E6869D7|nr:golgin subfamily A member 5 [Maniola jurtina]XP_045779153.1 golgin subfamily A member 5 [Maniola jurtina]